MSTLSAVQKRALEFLREGPTTDRSVVLLLGEEGPAAMQAVRALGFATLCQAPDTLDSWWITDAGRAALTSA